MQKLSKQNLRIILGKPLSKFIGFIKKHKVLSVIAIILTAVILFLLLAPKGNKEENVITNETVVELRDIKSVITESSVVEPNKEYSIKPLVSGEIIDAPFEEGDVVEKGQLMYQFDSSSMEKSIASANIGIEKAQQSYQDTIDALEDEYIKSTITGTVTEVYVQAGDNVTSGTKIASVSDTDTLKASIPFNASDANSIHIGDKADLTLVGTGSYLSGTVTRVSTSSTTTTGHMSVCYVTVEAQNPGALSAGDEVTAMIGSIACNDIGKFESLEEKTITAKASGTLTNLYITQSDYVVNGSTVGLIDTESDSKVRSAQLSLEDSLLSKEKFETQLEDYSITAPISGTVITKNLTVGDTYEMNNSSITELALIYDMSSLCFTLAIDELDVKDVKVGQSVKITADASETVYNGVVETVSISGTTSNGVTTYPVKVRINEFDDNLLPGMNIEATITTESAQQAVSVPISAVNRGNIVYVKGSKTDKNDRAPEGFYSVKVTAGISDDEYIQILSGISAGDIVYVPPISNDNSTPEMMMPGMGGIHGGMGGGMPGGGMGGGMPGGGGMPSGGGMPGGGR